LCQPCQAHFNAVRTHLDDRGIAYEVKPRMVRGLDYYMRTTFEIVHGALGAQNSVLGGGRYDGLAEALGSKVPSPGIGFSIGEDRLVMSAGEEHPDSFQAKLDLYIAPIGALAERHAAGLARDLRGAGCSVELGLDSKLKRSLELANKMGARFALIVGDNEMAAGQYTLKNMQSGEQQTVARAELPQRIK
jgi:histidyl-tRNA synthetase